MKRLIVAIGVLALGVTVAVALLPFGPTPPRPSKPTAPTKTCNGQDDRCEIRIIPTISSGTCTFKVAIGYEWVKIGKDPLAPSGSNKKVVVVWKLPSGFTFSDHVGIVITGNNDKYFKHIRNDNGSDESTWHATTENSNGGLEYTTGKIADSSGTPIDCAYLDPIIAND